MAFLNFGRSEEDRIVELDDRRVVFLPRGRGGPVHLIPDDAMRARLERRYRIMDRALNVALPAVTFGAMHYRRWDFVALAVAMGVVVPWWTARTIIERLPEVADAAAIHGTRRLSPGESGWIQRFFPDRQGTRSDARAAAAPENRPVEPRWRG